MAATALVQPWDVPYAGKDRWLLRLLPSLTDLAFFLPLILLLWLPSGLNGLLADGDTGWHIRTGEWILQHGAVPTSDIFSWTKAGQPWFAWEWGWDVVFALIHSRFGLSGVLFVNILLLCSASALLYRAVRSACDADLLALVTTAMGVVASTIHWLARPHLLSWIFFLVLLAILRRAGAGQTRFLRWLPLLLLVWTNMHGSFLVGVIMVLISGTGQALNALLQPVVDWRAAWRNSKPFWFSALGCAAVTFANPYGWHVHAHIFSYLRDTELLAMISEFQSTSFHGAYGALLSCLLLLGVPTILWCLQNRHWSAALAIPFWAHAALVSARNIPLFVFVVCPSIAAMLTSAGPYFRSLGLTQWAATAVESFNRQLRPFERVGRLHLVSVCGIALLACCFEKGAPRFTAHFTPSFPASAIPVIERAHPAHLFTFDQWGDYVLYRLYPGTRVYVDGRSDFFGKELLERSSHIVNARWDWASNLSEDLVDMVLIRPEMPLAAVLKSSPDWHVLFDDHKAIVFARTAKAGLEAGPDLLTPTKIPSAVRSRGKRPGAVWLASANY